LYQYLLAQDRKNTNYLYNLASLYQALGNKQQAYSYYHMVFLQDKTKEHAGLFAADYLREIGKHQKAVKVYMQIIRRFPEHIEAYHGCILSLQSVGQLEEALSFSERL